MSTKLNCIQDELSNDSEVLFEADQKIDTILNLMPNLFKLKDDFLAFKGKYDENMKGYVLPNERTL